MSITKVGTATVAPVAAISETTASEVTSDAEAAQAPAPKANVIPAATVKAGGVVHGSAFPTPAQAEALRDRFSADFQKAVTAGGGSSQPSELKDLARAWRAKDPVALKVWQQDPKINEGACIGAAFSVDGGNSWLCGRSLGQNADSSLWRRLAVQEGLIQPLGEEWVGILEVSAYFLDSGGWAGDDQLDAGRQILGQPNEENKVWNGQHWDLTSREKLAALVGSTGRHMFEHQGIGGDAARAKMLEDMLLRPNDAKALIRERLGGAAAPWLDDADQFRQLTDALFVLRLSDDSRGSAYKACDGKGDVAQLKNSSEWKSSPAQAFKNAVTKRK